jgi:hypothetical protein
VRHGPESFVFLGWLTPIAAIGGLALLIRRRTYGLAAVLGAGAIVPLILALGTTTPLYEAIRFVVYPLRYPRVPERLMPIACLAIAALAAFGVQRLTALIAIRRDALYGLGLACALVVLALDLRVPVFGAVAADRPSAAYAAMRAPGRLLELPVFRPDIHYGSVYLAYARQSPRERPQGYSTLAPPTADRLARDLRGLSCGRGEVPPSLGVRYVAVHLGVYAQSGFFGASCPTRTEAALRRGGWRLVARDGPITTYERR